MKRHSPIMDKYYQIGLLSTSMMWCLDICHHFLQPLIVCDRPLEVVLTPALTFCSIISHIRCITAKHWMDIYNTDRILTMQLSPWYLCAVPCLGVDCSTSSPIYSKKSSFTGKEVTNDMDCFWMYDWGGGGFGKHGYVMT